MVFPSIPAYLDPSNWQQQQSHHIIGSSSTNPLLPPPQHSIPPPPPLPPPPQPHGASGSVRPGSMSERARLANVPMPETSLKCPRCESTNTKFCYFNNYSLTQPRHFCKTCRRYWTRGGALRNVPVGGGCRRNKRSKSTSNSKSPASSDRQTTSSSTSNISTNNNTPGDANLLGPTPQILPPLRFMSPLGQITDSFTNDAGMNYSGISGPMVSASEMNFHGASNFLGGSTGVASLFSSGGSGSIEPWRLQQVQQFPFLGSLDHSSLPGIYQFHGSESGFAGGETTHELRPKLYSSMLSQVMTSVKMEGNPELNLSRQLLGSGIQGNNHDNWSSAAAAWNTELSSFNSSSTNNPL